MIFESCLQRNGSSSSSINKKNDFSIKILELLNSHEYKIFLERNKIPTIINPYLNKVIYTILFKNKKLLEVL